MQVTLEAARRNVGLTQKEAADRIGVSKVTISNWENGNVAPSTKYLDKILDTYKIDFNELNFKPACHV